MLKIISTSDRKAMERLLAGRSAINAEAERTARRILEDVRLRGDRALVRLTRRLDGVDLLRAGFTVTARETRAAYRAVTPEFLQALKAAARNIRRVAARQLPSSWSFETLPGVRAAQLARPLERVACYVPGGRYPLPSTVLMSVIPAQAAGVREILVTSPRPAPAVIVAADLLGVRGIFRLGGAQAIAAFAYGTESVPRAEMIVGPGNRYVAAAKKLVAGDCRIDFVAGPTELAIVGAGGPPDWIAADLVAQAEHDPDARAWFLTPSGSLAEAVSFAVKALAAKQQNPTAARALNSHGAIIRTRSLEEAIEIVNELAPEHLSLVGGAEKLVGRVRSAGSVFLGPTSPIAAGDYASGPNHILPTGGAARLRGGLSAADFVKTVSVQRLTLRGLGRLRGVITTLARTEGLQAHAYSIEARFRSHG